MTKDMTDEELDEVKEFRKHLYKLTSQSDFFSAGVEYGKRLKIAKDAAIYARKDKLIRQLVQIMAEYEGEV